MSACQPAIVRQEAISTTSPTAMPQYVSTHIYCLAHWCVMVTGLLGIENGEKWGTFQFLLFSKNKNSMDPTAPNICLTHLHAHGVICWFAKQGMFNRCPGWGLDLYLIAPLVTPNTCIPTTSLLHKQLVMSLFVLEATFCCQQFELDPIEWAIQGVMHHGPCLYVHGCSIWLHQVVQSTGSKPTCVPA